MTIPKELKRLQVFTAILQLENAKLRSELDQANHGWESEHQESVEILSKLDAALDEIALLKESRDLWIADNVRLERELKESEEYAAAMNVQIRVRDQADASECASVNYDNDRLRTALEFYADKDKYFTREEEVDLNETTAVFKSAYRENADLTHPNIQKFQTFDCSARLKADQGETARIALAPEEDDE